ncbi:hypothetical protein H646_07128 [Francisella tularensis subsp. tularensis 79201237]|nr:hypothetical protein FTH_0708 [Francisella tularensis subsp. holarctica OSU18]EKM87274.1 hypothetical protein B343_07136 [Francisella tularensis subsp. tularensis 80700075]EOA43652.1 hypothetical protein H646_07128 [Francisella tularensis subsp. tularensis 79201237]EOA45090.1 hypothetical protein H647_07143 [Francisella tularensis subsp. tularensis 80700069]EOA46702.1 hypothetical protein H643_07156 [Francisella tularensis subsp. tularensis 1378]
MIKNAAKSKNFRDIFCFNIVKTSLLKKHNKITIIKLIEIITLANKKILINIAIAASKTTLGNISCFIINFIHF